MCDVIYEWPPSQLSWTTTDLIKDEAMVAVLVYLASSVSLSVRAGNAGLSSVAEMMADTIRYNRTSKALQNKKLVQ